MSATMLAVSQSEAVSVLLAAGFKSAGQWPLKRLQEKIKVFNTLVDPDAKIEDAAVRAKAEEILAAIKEGSNVVIDGAGAPEVSKPEDGSPAAAKEEKPDAAAKKAEAAAVKAKEKADTEAAKVKEKAAAAAVKEKAKADKKAEAEKKAAEAKKEKTDGVKGRPYFAGVVIKKHGLEGGVTDAMATEVDELLGKPNPKESLAWLKISHQAIRGYLAEAGADVVVEHKEEKKEEVPA